ncbi:MAG: ACP S-malonyltransferase [bacterium]
MSNKAFIFPGQGSQFVGMAKDLYENFKEVKEVYNKANEILRFDLVKISFEGPEDILKQTRITQPAIFVHSASLIQLLRKKTISPDMAAGHSLGEYSALYAAGVLTFEDGLKLVKTRAELMQKAGELNPGTMAAVVGLETETVKRVCNEASVFGMVQVANFNSPVQIVISGSINGVKKAMELAKEHGAKKVIPLVVSGAFHSPLMQNAREGLEKVLNEIELKEASFPVYTNVDANPVTKPEAVKYYLREQLTKPVRWVEIIENMISHGTTEFYEIGPGNVLTGLLKRINREVVGIAVSNLENLEKI